MKRLFVAILACVILTMSAFARPLSYRFACEVEADKMPQGTVYVDMLIPLSEEDSEYSFFNKENGEKYGIEEDSEIATYNRDGFLSYTFRKKSARAKIKPFIIREDLVNPYIEFLSDEESCDGEDLTVGDFGEKYKNARFAYINADGKILGITNEIDFWRDDSYESISITLSGRQAVCEVDQNDVLIIMTLFIIFAVFAIPILVIAFVLKLIISRIKRSR